MVSRKKLVALDLPEMPGLRVAIDDGPASNKDKSAMIKDMLLVEAAIATDERIIALDDRVKALFSEESKRIAELRGLVWINPVTNPAGVKALLKADESERQWTLAAMSKAV